MPASIFSDMERSTTNVLEEQRALQLAMELSMFTLGNESESGYSSGGYESESRTKKSQNTTECVPVPSSEHVAEIVGRQGCKIKALRAKTNTYIKTPVRGEEPVFVVTGRKEDVSAAKREILSAAEHFSQIRAQRKNNMNGSLAPGPNSSIPGQTTIQVRVPYRVVGLVVGPKGATIKRIQQQTNTYIVTPSREKEPVFEVTGLPDNVETARKEIEAHIAMRTGGLPDSSTNNSSSGNNSTSEDDDFHVNGIERVFTTATVATTNYVNSLYKSDFGSAGSPLSRESNNILTSRAQDIFTFPTHAIPADAGSPKITDLYSCTPGFPNGFSNGFGLYDVDEGLGDSPTFEQAVFPSTSNVWSDFGPVRSTVSPLFGTTTTSTTPSAMPRRSNSLGSADSGISDPLLLDHPPARRIRSDPLVDPLAATFPPITAVSTVSTIANCFTVTSCSGTTNSETSPTDSITSSLRKPKRDCAVCFESEVVAALVPCGHNMFCLECANRICEKTEPECPICRQQALQAIRIYS